MSDKSTIKIKCENPELAEAMLQVFLASKGQLEQHLTLLLERKGIPSDTRISIQDHNINVTSKTPERNMVITSTGLGMDLAGYDTLPHGSKYIYVEKGAVKIFLKMEDGVDRAIIAYETIEEAVSNINSNDVIDAVKNILKETKVEDAREEVTADQNGDTPAAV